MDENTIDGEELGAENCRPSADLPSLNTQDVCSYLAISRTPAARLIKKGILPMYKNPITGRVLFKMSDVKNLKDGLNNYKRV